MASGTEVPDRVGHYKLNLHRHLGRGTFGIVYLGRHMQSGEEVAIKVIEPPVQVRGVDYMRYVQRELELLASIQHPRIVRLVQYTRIESCVYVVLELCKSDLQTFAIRNGLSHALKEQYARDSCAAMGCLHQMRIIHRDLKPENILVKEEGESVIFKFSDLGLSRRIPEGGSMSFTRGVGTRNWMAPEVSRDPARYSKPADMFGFGLTGLSVMDHTAGEALEPLTGPNRQCLAEFMNAAISRDETVQVPDVIRSTDSPQIRRLKEIYVRTICANPHTRLTIQQVCREMGHTADHWKAQLSEAMPPPPPSVEAMSPPPSTAEALAPSLSSAPVTAVHSADVGSSVHLSAAMYHSRNRQDSEANIPQLAAMDLSPESVSSAAVPFSVTVDVVSEHQIQYTAFGAGLGFHGEVILDVYNKLLHKMDHDGTDYSHTWEKHYPAGFSYCNYIAVDNNGDIFVQDKPDTETIHFTQSLVEKCKYRHKGTLLDSCGGELFYRQESGSDMRITVHRAAARRPLTLQQWGDGWDGDYLSVCRVQENYVVTDWGTKSMDIFDMNGALISNRTLNYQPADSHAITVTNSGHILVAERTPPCIHVYNTQYEELASIGHKRLQLKRGDYLQGMRCSSDGLLHVCVRKDECYITSLHAYRLTS